MSARLSVVIPAYRAAGTIERAVRSVLGQPGVEAEIIVVVDGPCADTENVLADIRAAGLTVVVNPQNMGSQKSRNRGLALATQPLVMFLDSDDYVTGDVLAGLASRLADDAADLAFAPWILLDEDRNICRRAVPDAPDPRTAITHWLLRRRWVPPCAVLWRAGSLRGIGGWDEAVARNQDGELVLRALLSGLAFANSRTGAGIYYQHESEHRVSNSAKNTHALLQVAEKLLEIRGPVFSQDEQRDVFARYLYIEASDAYRRGADATGDELLRRSRELGFTGHQGSWPLRMGAALLGPSRYNGMARRLLHSSIQRK